MKYKGPLEIIWVVLIMKYNGGWFSERFLILVLVERSFCESVLLQRLSYNFISFLINSYCLLLLPSLSHDSFS